MSIEPAPADRERLRTEFGCSRRLITRIGALLNKGLTLSAMVLEEARAGSLLESLLLHKDLLDASDPVSCMQSLLASDHFTQLQDDFPLVILPREEGHILAAKEESLAQSAFDNTPASTALSPAHAPLHSTPDKNRRSEADASEIYNDSETSRLRITIFTAPDSTGRIAALRQFSFAPLPEEEKLEVFLQAASDNDAGLRGAAAQGLRNLGVEASVSDAAQNLANGSMEVRSHAAERLADLAPNASDRGRDLILMSIFGSLRDPAITPPFRIALYQTLTMTADALGANRLCEPDMIRVLTGHLPNATEQERTILPRLFAVLDTLSPGWVTMLLQDEIAHSQQPLYRALLFDALSEIKLSHEVTRSLFPVMADTWRAIPTDTSAFRELGHWLITDVEEGLPLFLDTLRNSPISHLRAGIRLLDNALISQQFDESARVLIAQTCKQLLEDAPLQVRTDIIETSVCVHQSLPAALRREVTEILLRDLDDYAHWPMVERVENALVRFGSPAIAPIARALSERKESPHAALLAQALGRIGTKLDPRPDQGDLKEAEEILRNLTQLSFSESAISDALHIAMGRLCSRPGLAPAVCTLTYRTLTNRLRGDPQDAKTLLALGYCCAGTGLDDHEIRTVTRLCIKHLQTAKPDPKMQVDEIDGEEVFVLGQELDVYADMIPACLEALDTVFSGKHTTRAIQDEIVSTLLALWGPKGEVNLTWGPANAARLTESLSTIGTAPRANDRHRIAIIKQLANRASDPVVLEALASILSHDDNLPQHDRLAGSLIERIIKLLSRPAELHAEDHERYLRMLALVSKRGRFSHKDGGVDRILERMIDQFESGLRHSVPRALHQLQEMLTQEALPPAVLDRIRKILAQWTSLTITK